MAVGIQEQETRPLREKTKLSANVAASLGSMGEGRIASVGPCSRSSRQVWCFHIISFHRTSCGKLAQRSQIDCSSKE